MVDKLFDIEGKTVLVTGSARGLGFSFAKGFVQAKAKVVVNALSWENVQKAVSALNDMGAGKAYGYCFDICNQSEVIENVKDIEENVGPIDILVNNAGIHCRAPLEELSLEAWNKVINTNLTAAFIVSQTVAKRMMERKRGKIINITSLNAEMARHTIGNYCAAKGGLKMLTKSMATEWGRYNIQTNAIGPGYFITDLTQKLADDPEFDAWVKSEVPIGRWGQPDDLIGAAIFLASPASDYINGHTIYVDGGWQACL